MYKKTGVLSLLFFIVFNLNASECRDRIMAAATKVTTLSAKFKQEKHISVLKEALESEGYLYFKRPGKLRFEQAIPTEFILVFEDENVHIKEGGKKSNTFSMSSNKMFKEINGIIIGGISGDIFSNEKKYKVTYNSLLSGCIAVLQPKSSAVQKYISSIKISFNEKYYAFVIEIIEKSGDKIIIRFSNIEVNKKIDDNLFNFTNVPNN